MNETNSTSPAGVTFILPLLDTIIVIFFIIIMITLTAVGNLVVILAFLRERCLRNFSDFLILNLAISDFVIGLICIPLYVPYLLTGVWPFSHGVCLFWLTVDYVTPAASTISICMISLDRYLRVAQALWIRVHETPLLLALFLITPWALPSAFYITVIPFWEIIQGHSIIPDQQCFIPYHDNTGLILAGTFIEFIIPFLFVSISNIMIYVSIRMRIQVSKELRTGNTTTSQIVAVPTAGNLNKDRKAAKSLFIMVFVFGICWMPFEISALVLSVCPDCVTPVGFEISFWLLWINSTVNPILYPLLHRRYKMAFMKLLRLRGQQVGIQMNTTTNMGN